MIQKRFFVQLPFPLPRRSSFPFFCLPCFVPRTLSNREKSFPLLSILDKNLTRQCRIQRDIHSGHLHERCPLNREPIKLILFTSFLPFLSPLQRLNFVTSTIHTSRFLFFPIPRSSYIPCVFRFFLAHYLTPFTHSTTLHSISFSLSLSLVLVGFSLFSLSLSLCTDCELRIINDKLRSNLRYLRQCFFILYRVFSRKK